MHRRHADVLSGATSGWLAGCAAGGSLGMARQPNTELDGNATPARGLGPLSEASMPAKESEEPNPRAERIARIIGGSLMGAVTGYLIVGPAGAVVVGAVVPVASAAASAVTGGRSEQRQAGRALRPAGEPHS